MNLKAQLAARTMFALADRHGDILREGWQNILDCMLQLYRAKMLPTPMVEVRLQDFYKSPWMSLNLKTIIQGLECPGICIWIFCEIIWHSKPAKWKIKWLAKFYKNKMASNSWRHNRFAVNGYRKIFLRSVDPKRPKNVKFSLWSIIETFPRGCAWLFQGRFKNSQGRCKTSF